MLDGRCPACQKDTKDQSAAEERTTVVVRPDTVLPSICTICGRGNERRIKISHSKHETLGPTSGTATLQHLGVLGIFLDAISRRFTRSVTIHLPVCHVCQQSKFVYPRNVWFEERKMSFVAHRAFAEALREPGCDK